MSSCTHTHGIGKFLELTRREVSSGGRNAVKTTKEYLVLEYAPSKRGYPGDKLFGADRSARPALEVRRR